MNAMRRYDLNTFARTPESPIGGSVRVVTVGKRKLTTEAEVEGARTVQSAAARERNDVAPRIVALQNGHRTEANISRARSER